MKIFIPNAMKEIISKSNKDLAEDFIVDKRGSEKNHGLWLHFPACELFYPVGHQPQGMGCLHALSQSALCSVWERLRYLPKWEEKVIDSGWLHQNLTLLAGVTLWVFSLVAFMVRRRDKILSIKCGIEDKAETASIKSLKGNQTTQTTKMKVLEDEKDQHQGSTTIEMLKAGSFVLKQSPGP